MEIRRVVDALIQTKLKRTVYRGQELSAACPFHKGGRERRPSFSISLATGKWYCHACGAAGDIHRLCERLGVPGLAKGVKRSKRQEKKVTVELPSEILGLFDRAPKFLLDIGFSKAILKEHCVGFDPKLNRITFPVFSEDGKLRLISGRTVLDAFPRYLIYDAEAFKGRCDIGDYVPQKSLWLWRENMLIEEEPLIITEGFKACLHLAQLKLNSTATFGTVLSNAQIKKIRRFKPQEVYLFLDNNEAGIKATIKMYKKLVKAGITQIKIANYPSEGEQPDDLSRDEIRDALMHPIPINVFIKQHRKELTKCH